MVIGSWPAAAIPKKKVTIVAMKAALNEISNGEKSSPLKLV